MLQATCNICCDTYNKSTRSKVCCGSCDFDACKVCCETYILGENTPRCMNPICGKEWTRKFIRENLTGKFIDTKFKEHLEIILFDQEKALLPATQPLVVEKMRKEKIKKEIKDIDQEIRDLYTKKNNLLNSLHVHQVDTNTKSSSNGFVRQCPADDCRGFLSSQWKCGICEKWTCNQCHELKGDTRDCEHTCDPNNVETAKLLNNDSKPCPKCQCLIFKINGCDQMWCTQCHTAFSWKTGAFENNIHNPHYYEWKKNNGGVARAQGDIQCGRDLTNHTINNILNLVEQKHPILVSIKPITENRYGREHTRNDRTYDINIAKFTSLIRVIIHNNQVELHNFQTDYVTRNQELRIKFLSNEITEEEFKTTVQKNDKSNRKKTEIAQVLQLSHTASIDIIYRGIELINTSKTNTLNIQPILNELSGIIGYCNEIFKDIAFTYKCVHYEFNQNFEFNSIEKETKQKYNNAKAALNNIIK